VVVGRGRYRQRLGEVALLGEVLVLLLLVLDLGVVLRGLGLGLGLLVIRLAMSAINVYIVSISVNVVSIRSRRGRGSVSHGQHVCMLRTSLSLLLSSYLLLALTASSGTKVEEIAGRIRHLHLLAHLYLHLLAHVLLHLLHLLLHVEGRGRVV